MSLPALCIQRPVMTTSLTLAISLIGVIGYLFLPIAALPKVDFPTITVTMNLPGASPARAPIHAPTATRCTKSETR